MKMKNIKNILLCTAATLLCITAYSQERIKVRGTVVDGVFPVYTECNLAAGVSQSGTDNGTVTDADGKYVISVPSDASLSFSYISYITQEVAVGGRSVVDIKLRPDNTQLEEVVFRPMQ